MKRRSNDEMYALIFDRANRDEHILAVLLNGSRANPLARVDEMQDFDIVYVVDELERSLHPKLTERFLQLFMQLHEKERMQLLFTTHESSIMDQSIFRRDEIWFVERNADNASVIYSLDRFKERYDKVLSKAYLEGRYGAIPVFSTFEFREEE